MSDNFIDWLIFNLKLGIMRWITITNTRLPPKLHAFVEHVKNNTLQTHNSSAHYNSSFSHSPTTFLFQLCLQQGVRFDPDLPQTIRLEFAKSNTKVSKPKQIIPATIATSITQPQLVHPLTGRKYLLIHRCPERFGPNS